MGRARSVRTLGGGVASRTSVWRWWWACRAGAVLSGELSSLGRREAVSRAVFVPSEERMAKSLLRSEPVAELEAADPQRLGDLVWGDLVHDHIVQHNERESDEPLAASPRPRELGTGRRVLAI